MFADENGPLLRIDLTSPGDPHGHTHENKKGDIPGKPEAGTRDPKGKQAQLEEHHRKGRNRVPNTEDELEDCGTENKTSQEKVRIQQLGKNHRGNTN
jgi:hypothetical protein